MAWCCVLSVTCVVCCFVVCLVLCLVVFLFVVLCAGRCVSANVSRSSKSVVAALGVLSMRARICCSCQMSVWISFVLS